MPVHDPSLDRDKAQDVLLGKKVSLEADKLPEGDAKREAKRRELAEISARAEVLAKELGVELAKKPVIEREVAQHFGSEGDIPLEGLDHSHFKYALVWRDPYNRLGGRIVFSYKRDGWEVVTGGMPEYTANRDYHGADGTLHVVDTLLMRMPLAKYREMELKNTARRIAREEGVPAELLDLARRAGVKATWGDLPTEGGPESVAAQASRAHEQYNAARHSTAAQIAQRRFEQHLRAGTVPGAEIRRS